MIYPLAYMHACIEQRIAGLQNPSTGCMSHRDQPCTFVSIVKTRSLRCLEHSTFMHAHARNSCLACHVCRSSTYDQWNKKMDSCMAGANDLCLGSVINMYARRACIWRSTFMHISLYCMNVGCIYIYRACVNERIQGYNSPCMQYTLRSINRGTVLF